MIRFGPCCSLFDGIRLDACNAAGERKRTVPVRTSISMVTRRSGRQRVAIPRSRAIGDLIAPALQSGAFRIFKVANSRNHPERRPFTL